MNSWIDPPIFPLRQITERRIILITPPRGEPFPQGFPKSRLCDPGLRARIHSYSIIHREDAGRSRPSAVEPTMEKRRVPKPVPGKKAPPSPADADTAMDATDPEAGGKPLAQTEEFTMPAPNEDDAADFLLDEGEAKAPP